MADMGAGSSKAGFALSPQESDTSARLSRNKIGNYLQMKPDIFGQQIFGSVGSCFKAEGR